MSRRGRALAAGVALAAVAAVVVTVSVVGSADSGGESEPPSPPPPPPRSFFGVVPQGFIFAEDLDRMGEGKVGTIRLHLPWAVLDPTEADDYAFESIDGIVLGAAKNGIEVVPFMFGTPPWAAERDGHTDCLPDCATYAPRSPEALAAWNEFLEALVERYGPAGELWKEHPDVDPLPVHSWQIWNEQNSATFYRPRPDPQGYADLLAASEQTIHAVDPEAEIILGGMFGTPPDGTEAWDYLADLYETGAAESFDAIAVHPYGGQVDKLELQVELMREQVTAAGDDAATWITEIGWASGGPPNPYNKGRQGQAEQLEAAYGLLIDKRLEWEIENVSWYSWRDVADSPCEWCGGSGLFPEDSLKRPKPSWESYVALTGGS